MLVFQNSVSPAHWCLFKCMDRVNWTEWVFEERKKTIVFKVAILCVLGEGRGTQLEIIFIRKHTNRTANNDIIYAWIIHTSHCYMSGKVLRDQRRLRSQTNHLIKCFTHVLWRLQHIQVKTRDFKVSSRKKISPIVHSVTKIKPLQMSLNFWLKFHLRRVI